MFNSKKLKSSFNLILIFALLQTVVCAKTCKNEIKCLKKKVDLLVNRLEQLESNELTYQAQLAAQENETKIA